MSVEATPPKHATIINALQVRIENGTYRPGVLLPSEAALSREFAASRSTVARALEYLRQKAGWKHNRAADGRHRRAGPPQHRRSHHACTTC